MLWYSSSVAFLVFIPFPWPPLLLPPTFPRRSSDSWDPSNSPSARIASVAQVQNEFDALSLGVRGRGFHFLRIVAWMICLCRVAEQGFGDFGVVRSPFYLLLLTQDGCII